MYTSTRLTNSDGRIVKSKLRLIVLPEAPSADVSVRPLSCTSEKFTRQATNRDVLTFAAEAADLHASHTLQRFGQDLGGEFANGFRRDGVDDGGGVALGFDRILETLAHAGDDDFLQPACRRRNGLGRNDSRR